jgi:hypothetical protein
MNEVLLALSLVVLTGPQGQKIEINPHAVVTIRTARNERGTFAPGIKCLIHTADGKIVHVIEDCEMVRLALQRGKES